MYDFIEGTLETVEKDTISVKTASGIGFRIVIGKTSPFRSLAPKSPLRVWTELIVREDSHELFGFSSIEERQLFCLLQEVSGVGPKLAMSICCGLERNVLIHAIGNKDSGTLQEISGVGKKIAERVVLELNEKITKVLPIELANTQAQDISKLLVSQALLALKTLGFKEEEAKTRIKKAMNIKPAATTSDELIQRALQCIV